MEKVFKNEIKLRFPYLCNHKLILAISGGVDSVVLAHLCKTAKLDFALAHCNFNLRDKESDADEDFVATLAEELNVQLFLAHFDTEQYAKDHGVSIQMGARDLRYQWFEELRLEHQFDYVLTAHHANDSLETFFINLLRGTGIEGLSGINSDSNQVIRPLLNFSRKEIAVYAQEKNIPWREDSSNASTKYLRNKIRHQILPLLEELNPQFLETFLKTQSHLKEHKELVEDYMSLLYPKIIEKTRYGYNLDINYLKKIPNSSAVLYQLLKSFGFTQWNDVYNLLEAQPGKMVFSASHRLIKDREYLMLTELNQLEDKTYKIAKNEDYAMLPMGTFSFSQVEAIRDKSSNCIYVDPEKLMYPLRVRKWQHGDVFYPFGMKGKKKLSAFFKDKKLSLPEKENSWVLCSGDHIVWVVNKRADRRFSITSPDQKIIKITFNL